MKEIIGKLIKKYRLEMGFSQLELATSIGKTSPAYIALIEAGERNVSSIDLYKISEILCIPIGCLYGQNINFKSHMEAKRKLASIEKIINNLTK